jgi:hypothetical protein
VGQQGFAMIQVHRPQRGTTPSSIFVLPARPGNLIVRGHRSLKASSTVSESGAGDKVLCAVGPDPSPMPVENELLDEGLRGQLVHLRYCNARRSGRSWLTNECAPSGPIVVPDLLESFSLVSLTPWAETLPGRLPAARVLALILSIAVTIFAATCFKPVD